MKDGIFRIGRPMTRRRVHRVRRLVPTVDAPMPQTPSRAAEQEIVWLRAMEEDRAAKEMVWQLHANRMACLYARPIKVEVLPEGVPYKMLLPDMGWQRGRAGMIPSRKALDLPHWHEFVVSPETAAALIKRDSGSA